MFFFNKLRPTKVVIPQALKNMLNEYREQQAKAKPQVDACYNVNYDSQVPYSLAEEPDEDIDKIKEKIKEEKLKDSFNELLFKFIDKKGLDDTSVYKKAFVDRRLFSKIRSNKDYHPSKGTIIQLALALELSLDETLELLDAAGHSLPGNTEKNLVIIYIFENKYYDVKYANDLLYSVCGTTFDRL